MARLFVSAPDGHTGIFELNKNLITIGRGSANDLVLHDDRVSRFHAVLRMEEGAFHLADRGSTNGVLLNGVKLAQDTVLGNGDTVLIGRHALRFEDETHEALVIARAEVPATLGNLLKGHGHEDARERSFVLKTPPALDDTGAVRERLKKLEQENHLLSVLYDTGRVLQSRHSIEDIVSEILTLAFRIDGVERAFVMLLGEDGNINKQTDVRYRRPPEKNEPQIIFSRAVLERMKVEKVPILITDLSSDERFRASESMRVSGLRSAMCAPLVVSATDPQGRLAGVLYVDNMERTAAFTQEELNVFALVASQAASAIDNAMAHQKIARQSLERAALERFLAPEVVELVAANPHQVALGGANQRVSILFADIRGFTSLSETLPPDRIVEILNEYFTRVTEVIFDHGGTLDKYMGDGLMALFGAPFSKGDDALNAVKAALDIQSLMTELNRDAALRNWPELRVGIGVNTGVVTAGNIGSPKRLDYTVIGDAVNISSRLCGKAAPGEVLVSESTAAEVMANFDLAALEPVQMKGKSQAMRVFSVRERRAVART
jgi:adenylate cyclase